MSFEIVELEKQVFSGNKVVIPNFKPEEDFAVMSEAKSKALTTFAKNNKEYVGINTSINGEQCYIAASVGEDHGDTTFEVPAGKYAKFVSKETARTAIDLFIGQSYGMLGQSEKFTFGGNFNLEDLRESAFTIYLPVAEK